MFICQRKLTRRKRKYEKAYRENLAWFGNNYSSLLTITLGGSSIANARVDFINATLGTSSYKIEQGDSDSDGIYYESEFDNVEDLVKAKEQLAAEISSEGSVLFKNTDQTLPLDKSKEAVTLWGLNSHLPGNRRINWFLCCG